MKVQCYKVTRCGFYERRKTSPSFGNMSDLMRDLRTWVTGLDVSDTPTFDFPDEVPRRVFCTDMTPVNGNGVGIAFWNEVPADDGRVSYINMESRVGQATAQAEPTPLGSIPGWATYVWFLPEQDSMVTITPERAGGSRISGISQARKYIEHFLLKKTPCRVQGQLIEEGDEAEYEILGYRPPDADEDASIEYEPKFTTRPLYLPGPIEEIRAQWADIRKLIQTSSINYAERDQKTWLNNFTDAIGITNKETLPTSHKVKYRVEIDWEPESLEQLDEKIAEWRGNNVGADEIGFKFRNGGGKVHWLEKGAAQETLQVGNIHYAETLWNAETLGRVWQDIEPNVLRLLETAT